MCGINGIYAYHSAANAPNERELLATRDHMRARGPDGAGVWWNEDRRCGFGHRRLSIIDLSDRASQPMVSADGRYAIIFNGEIYNHRRLRSELEQQGFCFRSSSDTEVLLTLYAREGEGMLPRLRGMYAFAIWDNAKRGLFLARDAYGIKPLYTANDGWTFRFASQVRALLAGGGVSRDFEPAGLAGFHLFGSVPEPFTLYREIRSLPAGHSQWIDKAGPREPRPFEQLSALLEKSAREKILGSELDQQVREAVRDSVRAHLISDVEVGVFLSAGVDSGALLGAMRDAGQQKVRAITVGFDEFTGTPEDEVPLAKQVAEQYGAEHVVRRVGEREFHDDLPRILDAMDQPSIDGVNTWFVSKAASEVGLKVAISGLGGDELLGGYPSFRDVPQWHRRYGALASFPLLGRTARAVADRSFPSLAQRRPKALGMLEYAGTWAGAYLLRRALYLSHELPRLIGNDMAREGLRRLKVLHALSASLRPDPGSDWGRVCALESSNYMKNQLLRDADWAGMAHSLEIRVPLVDWPLMQGLASLLARVPIGAGKAALASVPWTPLPATVQNRTKTGFSVPTRHWMAPSAAAPLASISSKGLTSRSWSKLVLQGWGTPLAAAA